MKEKLLFGAAYYLEYQTEDRLEEDMKLMAAAGINTIRIAESTWSVEEPKDGEFDFTQVIRAIRAAGDQGIDVIVGTPTYALPVWVARLDPEMLGDNPYGPRQNFDITNPTYLKYAERIIRKLVARTATCPNVIGYQLDNETKHYGVHGPRVVQGFRDWLKERFGAIENVNRAFVLNHWSNSVASFDELPDPTGAVNPGYACAFEEYRRHLVTGFIKWQAEIVNNYKREDQFITHNLDFEWKLSGGPFPAEGFSHGVQPDADHYAIARQLTLAGTDVYCPAGAGLTGREIAFAGDHIRPLKRDNYLVLESQSEGFPGWLAYPGQLRLMALSNIASGASGVMYWPWMSIPGGVECYWKGILSHDGKPDMVYQEISEIGAMLKRLSPELCGLHKENRVAIVVSPEALHALRRFPTEKDLSYNDVLLEFYTALYELNVECDVIFDREKTWSGYDLLIFPQLYCASEELIGRVRDYVSKGGAVLASFRSFVADENLRVYGDSAPHHLTDVFGMHYSRFTRSEDGRWMELLEPDRAVAAGRYDHCHWPMNAAATRCRFGSGQAWYLGTRLKKEELKDFMMRVCAAADVPVTTPRWPVVSRRAVTAKGKNLRFLFNFSDEPQKLRCPVTGLDLLTNSYFTAGGELGLSPWDAAVLREE